VVSLAVVVGREVEAAHRSTSAMAEACAVLRSKYSVVVAGRCWRRREAGESVEEGWNIAVILASARCWVDGADAYDYDRHHAAFAVLLAVLSVWP
jgi:hypothetical protein